VRPIISLAEISSCVCPSGKSSNVTGAGLTSKGADGGYLVKISPEGFDHAIRSGDEASFTQFFESVQE